jgi:hypothetical protein
LEVEFGKKRAGKVGVLISAFENDAVKFAVSDSDGEIGFCLATGSEACKKFCVEERNPGSLRGSSPVKEGE